MKLPEERQTHIHIIHLTPKEDLGVADKSVEDFTMEEGAAVMNAIAQKIYADSRDQIVRFVMSTEIVIPNVDASDMEAVAFGASRLVAQFLDELIEMKRVCAWVTDDLCFVILCEDARLYNRDIGNIIESRRAL